MESSHNETSGDEMTSGTEESSCETDAAVEVESASLPEKKAGDAEDNTYTLVNKERRSKMKLDVTRGSPDNSKPAESKDGDSKEEKDIVTNKEGRTKRKFDVIGGSCDKKKPGNGEEKKRFERLFGEEEEVAILKGMLKKGLVSCYDALLVSIKDSLSVVVNSSQLAGQVRNMRKRFIGWEAKEKLKEDLGFSEIQTKIWKLNGDLELLEKEALGPSVVALDNEVNSEYPHLLASFKVIIPQQPMGEFLARKGLELLDPMVTKKLDERWKDIIISQMQNRLEMFDLLQEQTKLIMDVTGLSPS